MGTYVYCESGSGGGGKGRLWRVGFRISGAFADALRGKSTWRTALQSRLRIVRNNVQRAFFVYINIRF